MSEHVIEEFCPATLEDWRLWLEEHHERKESVWLLFYNAKSDQVSLKWTEMVDIALCYGWIDSKRQTVDAFSYRQFYSRRKPNSTWSKVNKDKVQVLLDAGLMRPAGLACIEVAKKNGSWTILDEVEELFLPKDLEKALKAVRGAMEFYEQLSKSKKKQVLSWIVFAKRAETRAGRIGIIAELAGEGKLPGHF